MKKLSIFLIIVGILLISSPLIKDIRYSYQQKKMKKSWENIFQLVDNEREKSISKNESEEIE
ncbi:hypothetical protein KQI42_02835 [Tissierella sp. MSJ-40]|uniref:Uncharacterized protein n=1 Tax=Tissierella simiarum TaxID=2841534 RepID=A0ABS6E202_9FIRM|nr:hypothetical protein [Tissierella simiarum]MBU5436927.1 hypothetical protein [Tissierella simiarum]